ncbi:db415c89-9d26-4dfb-a910-8b1d1e1d032d [Sclerotinia trifoliorum]|uniref:Db415c89-9d26-4dfb-a910-8b1d1e1d032d n=1 Tax=Sclerotinia trifoliorum TaxID=28548 RepID=A0A8H2W137_9HELO|nr:db415c89-9d26-4dfb-a910-8b1d1e1d032d [Sclerotinia trifoliorum]
MQLLQTIISIAAFSTLASATLKPATSNTKGFYPKSPACKASKVSYAIQAAECAHNTRVSGTQTFAVFEQVHKYDSAHGAPYGTCSAYTCTAPTKSQLTAESDYWVFYWGNQGTSSGVGSTCIKSPVDGTCGCEDSGGTFVYKGTSCK